MADVRIEAATLAHAAQLATSLRPADEAEVCATGSTPELALRYGIQNSEAAWAAFIGDELMAVGGVMPAGSMLGGGARLWFLTSPVVETNKVAFWRFCRRALPAVLARWPRLVMRVDARYTRAVETVRRLGFRVHTATPYKSALFHFVELEATHG